MPEGERASSLEGHVIDFEEGDPEIRRLFEEELTKTGVPWRMSKFFLINESC